jgi:hypothetical protein
MTTVKLTPAIDNLEAISKECDEFECAAVIRDKNGDEYILKINTSTWFVMAFAMPKNAPHPDLSAPKDQPNDERPFLKRLYRGPRPGKSWFSPGEQEYTFAESMIELANGLPFSELLFDTIKVRAKGSSLKAPELKQAALEAWCEAKGVAVPTTKELNAAKKNAKNLAADKRKNSLNNYEAAQPE